MIEIREIDTTSKSDWHNLLANSPTSSYFQSPEFYAFFKSLTFLETFGWSVYQNEKLKGLVCGYLIANGGKLKRYFSRRAIIHGGLLLAADVDNAHVSKLLNVLKSELSRKAIYIEIRNNCTFDPYRSVFQDSGFDYHPHLNYKVDTGGDLGAIKTRYSESKIRQIKKSKKQGVVFELVSNQRDIDEFYRILFNLYKQKIRKPLFPKEFFDKFVKQPNCYLFVAKKDKKVIGGIACAAMPDHAVYEWFVCGDSDNYNQLYPSVFVTHKGIEFAAINGFKYFDFMGAGKPDVEYGVREFKEKFGGELYELGRFRCVANKLLFNIGKFVIETIKGS